MNNFAHIINWKHIRVRITLSCLVWTLGRLCLSQSESSEAPGCRFYSTVIQNNTQQLLSHTTSLTGFVLKPLRHFIKRQNRICSRVHPAQGHRIITSNGVAAGFLTSECLHCVFQRFPPRQMSTLVILVLNGTYNTILHNQC